jgi:hypothetical protein
VPIYFTKDGKLRFSMKLKKGIRVSLSYSKPEYLLRQTLAATNAMANFRSQGMMLFACMMKRRKTGGTGSRAVDFALAVSNSLSAFA